MCMYSKEVYRSRCLAGCVWVFLLTLLSGLVLTFSSNWSPFHPILWLENSFRAFLSLNFIVFAVTFGFLGAFSILTFGWIARAKPLVFSTRLERWLCPFLGSNLLCLLVYCLVGALLAKLSITFLHPNSFSENLSQLFVRYCCWMGLYFFTNAIWKKDHCLVFPSIQKSKLFRIKDNFKHLVYQSLITSLKALKYFLPLHFIAGFRFSVLSVGLWELCDLGLIWHLLLHGIALSFTWALGHHILTTFQTQELEFPILSKFNEENQRLLSHGLAAEKQPWLQQLAYHDLSILSQHSADRRKQIFSLSQPGGIPRSWQALSQECLKSIDTLAALLEGREPVIPPPDTPSPPNPSPVGRKIQGWPDVATTPTGNSWERVRTHGSKAWATSPVSYGQSPVTEITKRTTHQKNRWWTANASTQLKAAPQSMATHLKTRPVFSHLIGPLLGADKRKLFAGCQCHIWAVEAMSHLLVASYYEDYYGVVQKDLVKVVSSLLNLLQAVDEHAPGGLAALRSQSPVIYAEDATLRYSLKSALLRGITAIARTFKSHIKELGFSSEHTVRLYGFADCKD